MDEDKKVDEEEEQTEQLTTNEEFIQDIGHGCLFFCFVFSIPIVFFAVIVACLYHAWIALWSH